MSGLRPPQLLFDDGSRVIQQHAAEASSVTSRSARGSVSISQYYEIERLSNEIWNLAAQRNNSENDARQNDDWLVRVALQFPDNLLCDSPEVCWALEDALLGKQQQQSANNQKPALVFCLGDTTFGPCCPDEVAALHLNADVLVHFGHACLSHPALSLPVLYSFGVTEHWDVDACVTQVLKQAQEERTRRLLLLYQVQYLHAMEDLQTQLSERGDLLVITGQIPMGQVPEKLFGCLRANESCCEGQDCGPNLRQELDCQKQETYRVGGLELPKDLDFSSFSVVFIGDLTTSDGAPSDGMRQYVNTMLWFLSAKSKPAGFWTYSPLHRTLETSVPPGLQRQLNRRFYLIQKARDASIYGILIGTLSQQHFRSVVQTLRRVCQEAGRTSYTLAMGKVNPAKIANFAEIECFVMVACAETSWLEEAEQRELHVPIITPLELHMALGGGGPEVQWGTCEYSLDYSDFLELEKKNDENHTNGQGSEIDETTTEKDAPYFSLVTGKYETSVKGSGAETIDLRALPGKGKLTTYKSEAAEFLKHREYKGLEAQIGETEVRAAIPGQDGIASEYNTDKHLVKY